MIRVNPQQDLERFFSNAIEHQKNNEIDKACCLYKIILKQIPNSPLVNYNYGLALYELGQFEKSKNCYKNALKEAPDNVDILYNLALCYKKLGDYNDTVELYEKILLITPKDYESHYNLGCCFKDMNEFAKAKSSFLKVLELSPDHQSSINNLAYLYHKEDDHKAALHFYSLLLQINPNHIQAKHMSAALQGDNPETAPLQYVEDVFDEYSINYDNSLVKKLHYNVPRLMYEHFYKLFESNSNTFNILDLGCGTGLSGQVFKNLSSSLVGIDISTKMLDIAAGKGLYDSLHAIGIEDYLKNDPSQFNFAIAADVFTYIGDLKTIFELLFEAAELGTIFCFSTEKCDNNNFKLSTTGRFSHSLFYIEKVSLETGWKIKNHFDVDLRKEKDQWMRGMLFFLQKGEN